MKNRETQFRRFERYKHITRKKKIIHDLNDYWGYKFDGTLDKGKIHCSCPLCRHKSYDFASAGDIRRALSDIDAASEYLEGTPLIEKINHRVKSRNKKSLKNIKRNRRGLRVGNEG